jgi:hypothetical protein
MILRTARLIAKSDQRMRFKVIPGFRNTCYSGSAAERFASAFTTPPMILALLILAALSILISLDASENEHQR